MTSLQNMPQYWYRADVTGHVTSARVWVSLLRVFWHQNHNIYNHSVFTDVLADDFSFYFSLVWISISSHFWENSAKPLNGADVHDFVCKYCSTQIARSFGVHGILEEWRLIGDVRKVLNLPSAKFHTKIFINRVTRGKSSGSVLAWTPCITHFLLENTGHSRINI